MKLLSSSKIPTNFAIPCSARPHRFILLAPGFRMEIKPRGPLSISQSIWQTVPDENITKLAKKAAVQRECQVREFICASLNSLREACSQS